MDVPAQSPFREEDLPGRVQALRGERDALLEEIARVKAEIATLTPWSWKKFFLGLLLLPVSVGIVVLVFVRV
jgi:hypothetical protein